MDEQEEEEGGGELAEKRDERERDGPRRVVLSFFFRIPHHNTHTRPPHRPSYTYTGRVVSTPPSLPASTHIHIAAQTKRAAPQKGGGKSKPRASEAARYSAPPTQGAVDLSLSRSGCCFLPFALRALQPWFPKICSPHKYIHTQSKKSIHSFQKNCRSERRSVDTQGARERETWRGPSTTAQRRRPEK